MATVLLILKIIFRVILIIALVITVLIALLLFTPFQYKVQGKGNGTFKIKATVRWLLFVLIFTVEAVIGGEKQKPKLVLRIFGIPIKLRKRDKKRKKKGKKEKKAEKEAAEAAKDEKMPLESEQGESSEGKAEAEASVEGTAGESASGADKEEPPKKKGGKFKGLMSDEGNKKAINHILEEVKKMLKRILPKRIKANVVFSTGDPSKTGILTGVLSMVPYVYDKGNKVIPDFASDEAYLKGTISAKGNIILIRKAMMAIRLLKDKNVRNLIKNLRGKNQEGKNGKHV